MKHLTVGELISKLEQFPKDEILYTSTGFNLDSSYESYRGYYEDVAFGYTEEYKDPEIKVVDFLKVVKSCVNSTLHGWKGGEYSCDEDTLCWVANEGDSTELKVTDVVQFEDKIMLIVIKDKYK